MATVSDDLYVDENESAMCSEESVISLRANLSFLYYFIFLFSLCGNGLVLVIIHRFEKLTTVTNILLLNLVLSSLIFTSSLPFMAVKMQLETWIFGRALCKILNSFYYLGFYSSVLFLTLLTFDRYLAIVYSLGAPRVRNRWYASCSCAGVWLISSLACIKPLIINDTYRDETTSKIYCDEYPGEHPTLNMEHLLKAGRYIDFFLFFMFPLVVIICCYIKITITVLTSRLVTKFQTVRLIFIIVLLFFFCWTPYNIALLLYDKNCEQSPGRGYAVQITRNIAHTYFCISPIFYTFVGKKFQNYFRQILVRRFPGLKRHFSVMENTGKSNMSTRTTPDNF